MPKCLIIGGGIAGLTAAVNLCNNGIDVELFEISPKLGGRAYSFFDKKQGTVIDNGQHVLMGCYKNTLDYLTLLGTKHLLTFQNNLSLNYVERGGRQFKLEAPNKIYPFNLLSAILKFEAIPPFERYSIVKLFLSLLITKSSKYNKVSVYDWLRNKGQSDNSINLFWEMIVVSIMNTDSKNASAGLFLATLKKVFFTGNFSTTFIIPKCGLSEIFCDKAEEIISKNGILHLSEKITELKSSQNEITEVVTDKGSYNDFDFIISAIPFSSLVKIYHDNSFGKFSPFFNYSPIVTVNLWLKNNIFDKEFYGFLNSNVHWLFNHKTHISLITSNAVTLINKSKSEILKLVTSDIKSNFPKFDSESILASRIIKEKRATFIPTNEFVNIRDKIKSKYSNMILAGDWTDTGLPSTIESAAKSGKDSSLKVIKSLRNSRNLVIEIGRNLKVKKKNQTADCSQNSVSGNFCVSENSEN